MAYLTPAVCKVAERGAEGGHHSQVQPPSCLATAMPFFDEISSCSDCSMAVAGRRGRESGTSGLRPLWGLIGCLAAFSKQLDSHQTSDIDKLVYVFNEE